MADQVTTNQARALEIPSQQPSSSSSSSKPDRQDAWWKVHLFRGIVNDLKKRAPYYMSDWRDAWDYRVVPATVYMYFAKYNTHLLTFALLLPLVFCHLFEQSLTTTVIASCRRLPFLWTCFRIQTQTMESTRSCCPRCLDLLSSRSLLPSLSSLLVLPVP